MSDKKSLKIARFVGICATISSAAYLVVKFVPKMSIKKYMQACLYIAVMDDEICRNELEGNIIGGKEIVFPPKRESLQYRYHLFLSMYKNYSSKKLEKEIVTYEKRLQTSKRYINRKKYI